MGNSRVIKLALVFGRCKVIEAEDSGGYYYGEYCEPIVSRFAYHALLEFHHQHYPAPKLIEYRWLRCRRMWLARLLLRIDRHVRLLYRWRLNRAKCIGIRGLNWFYHCPKCGAKLFYSPRTHPCPSCIEAAEQEVVGNSQIAVVTESNHDPYTDYGVSPEDESSDEIDEDDLAFELDKEPEDDW